MRDAINSENFYLEFVPNKLQPLDLVISG